MGEVRKCKISGEDFKITDEDLKFYEKIGVPPPTLCPEERLRRRLSYRNGRKIYKDKCDLTGKSIISLYSPGKPFTVYSQEAWWSDDWDSKEYGRDFDFNKGFFEQFHELQMAVPRLSLMNTNAENSEFCNITIYNKNCYLVFGGDFNEDCMYSLFCMHSKNCIDTYYTNESQLSYELIDSNKCYNCKYLQNSHNCHDSVFLFECRSCNNCACCVGLRNRQYHIFNKKYSKEEYEQKLKEFGLDSWEDVNKLKKEFVEFKLKFPHKFANIVNCENSVGDNLFNTKNCENCFDVTGPAEDLKDIYLGGWGFTDSCSCNHVGHGAELFYEMVGSVTGHRYAFGTFVWNSHDVFYGDMIVNNSHDLFGCCNMKKAEYCILNKQYSKEDYEDLRARIVEHMKVRGEWGEFFPMKNSPWAYNETVAQDLFPMAKQEIEDAGLKWLDEEKREIGSGEEFPDSIHDVVDEILGQTFVCEKTGRAFKINEKELKFYRKLEIPIPHFAPETRNEMRLAARNPHKVWDRKCAKCGEGIKTSYAPERPERVYCEECYLEEVY